MEHSNNRPYTSIEKLLMGAFFVILIVLVGPRLVNTLKSSTYSGEAPSQSKQIPVPTSTSAVTVSKPDCGCTIIDVQRLVEKLKDQFTDVQNRVESQDAKVISQFGSIDKRDNCTWIVTFKISSPWGNSDGQHPDEFIEKRIACDGKEVYTQN